MAKPEVQVVGDLDSDTRRDVEDALSDSAFGSPGNHPVQRPCHAGPVTAKASPAWPEGAFGDLYCSCGQVLGRFFRIKPKTGYGPPPG